MIYVDQSLHFHRPVGLGDTITVTVKVTKKVEETHRVIFACRASNQRGEEVITGTTEFIAPTIKSRARGSFSPKSSYGRRGDAMNA